MADLVGQKAVVTGSGGLMGGSIAETLARAGCDIVLNDRVEGRTDQYEERIRAMGRDVISVVASVVRKQEAQRVIQAAMGRWGQIDILVNVVGGIKGAVSNSLWEMSEDEWDATIAVNLKSLFQCTRLVVPIMLEQRFGKIVNIASIAWGGEPSVNPAYVASKAGVVGLTRALATRLGPYGINVNAVAPGITMTGALDKMPDATGSDWSGRNPLGRPNDPADVAAAVEYLVSPGARNVSGQLITVASGLNPGL